MRTSLLTVLALQGLLAAAACNVSAPSSSSMGATTVVSTSEADAGGEGGGAVSAPDGAEAPDAAAAPSVQNNQLCVVTSMSMSMCDPDNPESASSCHLAPDGGAYDPAGGYADAGLACRVQPAPSIVSNGLGDPTACSVAGSGTAGESCKMSTDCAAGFDCIGMGVCRHYCCAGNGQCASDEFCDIQDLATATTTKVPVCMPITPPGGCGLLPSSADCAPPEQCSAPCPNSETCAVVREDGATGCVETGPARAGGSCDADHCGNGLVCLGALNARLCYALCDTTKADACTAPQTCQGGLPLFQDPSVGVCR
jgi:hypothetical protein